MKFPDTLLRFGLLLVVLLATGCASQPRISSEADPSADFSRYRSFAFHAPLAVEDEGYTTIDSRRMRDAARREMEARGYVFDETTPDLLVNINASTEERVDTVGGPAMYMGYYGYRSGPYGYPFWGGYGFNDVRSYTEGTLNIDLVDARERRLVWEGLAVGRIARLKQPERAARIDSSITEIFAAYPHRAGSR